MTREQMCEDPHMDLAEWMAIRHPEYGPDERPLRAFAIAVAPTDEIMWSDTEYLLWDDDGDDWYDDDDDDDDFDDDDYDHFDDDDDPEDDDSDLVESHALVGVAG